MKRAECMWGDGPDVVLDLKDDVFVLYEDPIHVKSSSIHGHVTKGSMDLTADEALQLAADLEAAANNAKEMDRMCEDHDKEHVAVFNTIDKWGGSPLTEKEMKEVNEDYPIETLTCHKCPHRETCKYVDDLYNTHGDCLATK